MWPWDFANRLSLIKCFYSSEKNKTNPPKPIVFRIMTFPLAFQKVSPSWGFFPTEFSSSRVYGGSLHCNSLYVLTWLTGREPSRMAVYSEAVFLAPVLFIFTKYLSLSGGSRWEGRDGAFDFPVFAGLHQLCWSWRWNDVRASAPP